MFPKKLKETMAFQQEDSEYHSEYEISDSGYGKDNVRLLHIERDGLKHIIREYEVGTHLKLYSKKDYVHGDNSDLIATDSQKNTVYLLAKKFGIKNPEQFGMLLAGHFLTKYRHIEAVHIHVTQMPWKRINYRGDRQNEKHNHAFVHRPVAFRFCDIFQTRHDRRPTIVSGLKDLRIIKSTQSSFTNFVDDEYRSLPDADDRVFSTSIRASWQYEGHCDDGINFNQIWHNVLKIILNEFAGDYVHGTPSPSAQHTIYLAEREVLKSNKEISVINMEMPNIHYILFDTKKYPKVIDGDNKEVFTPTDKPNGIIFAQLRRKNLLSKL